jgi:L-alanine-DL-glutamate epimerase-like enolase superfamily enzyme
LRKATRKTIRVDVNGGWSLEEAMAKFPHLISLGVEFVEQPLPRGELKGMKRLRDEFPLPIFADEDALTPEDVPRLTGVVDGINVKLMKCGGVGPALRMMEEARKRGLKVMLGCMIESSVGITAAAHLAPLADYLDLDGNLLIEDDPFTGVLCDAGRLVLPHGPGLGVTERSRTPNI